MRRRLGDHRPEAHTWHVRNSLDGRARGLSSLLHPHDRRRRGRAALPHGHGRGHALRLPRRLHLLRVPLDHRRRLAALRPPPGPRRRQALTQVPRSEEHTSELQSLMRISYAVFCLKKKKKTIITNTNTRSKHIEK